MLALFVLGQAALGAWLQRRHPEMCDPNFALRYERLENCLQAAPGRGLVLILGSSRPANGLSPSALADWQPRHCPAPVVFNFATLGAGPVRELLTYRQLRARGIHPELLLVEVWPPVWTQQGYLWEKPNIFKSDMYLSDVPVLAHLYDEGWRCFTKVCEETLTPILYSRRAVLNTFIPSLVPRSTAGELTWARAHWATLDPWGWLPMGWHFSPEEFARQVELYRQRIERTLQELTVPPEVDWALRQLLAGCRAEGTRVAFVILPEHSMLRSWYTPGAQRVSYDYFHQLEAEFGCPTIDTRDWTSDEGFSDPCHITPEAAVAYSARFGREVLRPLLEGTPLPEHLLLHEPGQPTSYPASSAPAPITP
jgi:hypothetical protein